MRKVFALALALTVCVPCAGLCADTLSLEREARIIRVELNRLGSSGDPFEREALLRSIIDRCKGTEEGEMAYWDLADLYLDGFPEEMRQEAREVLELCLKAYPNTNRALLVKCRLVDLYDAGDRRRAELVRELASSQQLPAMVKASMN